METPQCRFRRRDELQNGLDAFSRTKRVRMDSVPPPQTDKTKSFLPSVVPLPSEILVPSIFGIHSRKEPLGYYANPETWRYGKTEIQISGYKLNIKDQDVFIALSQLAIERRTLTLLTTFSDLMCQLTRRLHKSYTQESKSSIEKSLERLTGGTIKIANDAGDSWFIGHLISYAGRKKGQMIVSLDPFFNRLFAPFGEFHMTPVDVKFRLSLKGEVTKQLFVFYQRQVSANPKRKEYRHAIELEKLCYLIGFDRDNKRPLSWKRFLVKTALAELRANKYLRTYSLKDDRVNVTTNAKEQWRSEKLESRERPKETEESAARTRNLRRSQ